MKKLALASATVLGLLTPANVMAYGLGYVTYPLMPQKRIISTEFTGITSSGGGVGLQGRFTQKINERLIMDGGIGISGGQRDSRFFVGADYEIFPDYMKQPRFSVKTTYTNAKEFNKRRSIFQIAPTISKGFSFWGHEAFPYFSLPIGANLNNDNKTYQTQINASVGISGNLPFADYKNLLGNIEATVGVKSSYTALFMGVSYPLN